MTRHLVPALLFSLLVAHAGGVSAQTLKGVTVDPATAAPGQPVTVTATFDVSKGLNCNVRFHFGDGKTQDAKVNQEKDAQLALTHTYAKPGSYDIKIEPKTALPALKCLGPNQMAKVTVAAPAPAAAAPATAAAAAPSCPEGWKLDGKSVSKKTGAFTCRAKAGTPLPPAQARPACPGKLKYHENAKSAQLGCRP